jgi:LmeA-like phospholipid-binding
MPDNNSQTRSLGKIRIITNILTAAIKLWLRSQVSQVSQLDVEIQASDRQLLSGSIPWVSIFASHAIYQGLHITQIKLTAENIQVNIGQVLKGQPLQLLQIVPVIGELLIDEKDLNSSLSSELLSTALNDVLDKLLPEYVPKSKPIFWQEMILDNHQIKLNAILTPTTEPTPLEICLNLELLLSKIQVKQNAVALLNGSDTYNLDLGSDADIQELTLIPGKLVCRGRVNVNP